MSTKTTAEKLLVKPETTMWISHPERVGLVDPLPDGVRVVEQPKNTSTALLFGDDAESLAAVVAANADALATIAQVWVAYPKGNRTDINRESVWPILAEHDLKPIGQVSLSDVWSAMRFRPLQPGEAPFTGGAKA
jgi:hypothetical protein